MNELHPGVQPGIRRVDLSVVEERDTAKVIASGTMPTLGTPVLILFAERCCADSVHPLLEKGYSTLGSFISARHLAPTPVGMNIRCESELIQVDGRRLVFKFEVFDEVQKLADGVHVRHIIREDRFMEKINSKKPSEHPAERPTDYGITPLHRIETRS